MPKPDADRKTPDTVEEFLRDGPYPGIPSPGAFVDEEGNEVDFLLAADLSGMAQALVTETPRFSFLRLHDLKVVYLWAKTGGKRDGKQVWGKCQKPSGLLKHFAGCAFVVMLSADHLTAAQASRKKIEAVLYHEHCHMAVNQDGDPITVGHDWTGFNDELLAYGAWEADLRMMVQVAHQVPMPGFEQAA